MEEDERRETPGVGWRVSGLELIVFKSGDKRSHVSVRVENSNDGDLKPTSLTCGENTCERALSPAAASAARQH